MRIAIIGNSGSGKSTLSRCLADRLNLPLLTIDKLIWKTGWRQGDMDHYDLTHGTWMRMDEWIIDGVGSWSHLTTRIKRATHTIIFELPVETCIERAKIRMQQETYGPNADVAPGCKYSDIYDLQMEVIESYHRDTQPKIREFLESCDGPFLTICNSESTDSYVKRVLRFVEDSED